MSNFKPDLNPDKLMSLCLKAISQIDPNDLAYLFATGKSELEIRNQIALNMHRIRGENQVICREWRRHDLAVLENGEPRLIIEGKSWIHADAAKKDKLLKGKNSIKSELIKDRNKVRNSAQKFGKINQFISLILFTIDVGKLSSKELNLANVKYAATHLSGIKRFGSATELAARSRSQLSDLLKDYGQVKRAPLVASKYLGMEVEADFFLVSLDRNFRR